MNMIKSDISVFERGTSEGRGTEKIKYTANWQFRVCEEKSVNTNLL